MKISYFLFALLFAFSLHAQPWVEVTSGTSSELQGIGWAGPNVVWVSASDGSVIKSIDGGTTWLSAGTTGGGEGYYSIAALDQNTAIVAFGPNSGDGKIYKTTNGGTNWTQVYTLAGSWFNFVDAITPTELWAQSDPVGGNFLILRSTDAGNTWFSIATPVAGGTAAGAANSFYRIGSTLWFGTSSSNKIFKSSNGPEGPWTSYSSTRNNVGTIAFSSADGSGLAGFWSSTYLAKTTDGGQTWSETNQTIGAIKGLDYITSTSRAWAATATGIWKTTDDGTTWTEDASVTTGLNWIKFYYDVNKGIAVGPGGKIYKSTMTAILPEFLTHNTGTLQTSVFKNSYIGHDFQGTLGAGIKYGSAPDAMYTAGLVYGNSTTGVQGLAGSFTSSNLPVINDYVPLYGVSGFASEPLFNQVTYSSFTDANAPFSQGLNITQRTFSNTGDDFVIFVYDFKNTTSNNLADIHVGIFADWDVGSTNYASNRGGIEPAYNLVYQYLNMTSPNDPNYYGFVALNGLSGGKVIADFEWSATTLRGIIYDYISTLDLNPVTANGDMRSYIGSGPFNIDAGKTVTVGFAVVAGTSLTDLIVKAQLAYQKGRLIVPVELTSFTAMQKGNVITLNWTTATETNNRGFEIERQINSNGEWTVIGFKQGSGTAVNPSYYSFIDEISNLNATSVSYRLKQIDYDGKFEYSNVVMVENILPAEFTLFQNYPNPFNPSTVIKYQLPADNFVTLKVYNSLGEEVRTLVNGMVNAGTHEIKFDAKDLSSGVYLYVLRAGENDFIKTMKMILMK